MGEYKPEIPCGRVLGHGECCCEKHLCGHCTAIKKQEKAKEVVNSFESELKQLVEKQLEKQTNEGTKSQLTEKDMQSIFHILLQHGGGGIEIPLEVLENYPEKVDIRAEYDEVNKIWRVFIPKKRRRKKHIAVPRRDLILPGQF